MKKTIIKTITFIIAIFTLFIIFIAYDYFSTTFPKNVNVKELNDFKKFVIENYEVDNIEIYFSRPNLWIEISSKECLDKEKTGYILKHLKSIINKANMDKIAKKYWSKNASLYGVYLVFNRLDGNSKIQYLNIETDSKNNYNNWSIEERS